MELRTQLLSGILLIFIMIAIITVVNYQRDISLIDTANWVSHTHRTITKAELIKKLVVDMETGERGFLITGKEQFLEPFKLGKSDYLKDHSDLNQLVSDNPAQVIRLREIDLLVNRWLNEAGIPEIEIRRDMNKGKASFEDVSAVILLEKGKKIMDEIRIKSDEFISVEKELLAIRSKESEKVASRSIFISITGSLFSILLGIVIMILISRDIMRKIGGEPTDILEITKNIATGELDIELEDEKRTATGVYAAVISMLESFKVNRNVIESSLKVMEGITSISETMIGQYSMQEFGSELLKLLMRVTGANMSTFYILNEDTSEYEHFTSVGANKELLISFNLENPEGEVGNAISQKNIYYLRNIPEDTIFKYRTFAGEVIPKEIITIPILVENSVVALISLVGIQQFSNECYDILKNSWTNINTSYSNLIASERTTILAEYLSSTNQQLEAQTEELQEQAEELQDQAEELQRSSEELQEQNIELEAQRKQVEEANKMKSDFLSNMSHELRTPLNSILGLTRVLVIRAKDKLNDKENDYLEIIERNGKRLLSLINDILDLSKIEAGKIDILLGFISVGNLLQTIKENTHTLSAQKGLALTLSVPDNLPKIETDEKRLYQVLLNIIGNAVKFTEKGSVDISVENDSRNVLIKIKDSGIGISQEVIPYIFDEFRQADGSTSRQYEGTGLGLAIANKMMKILGGVITVKSKLGHGSVFTITVPVKWHGDIHSNGDSGVETLKAQPSHNINPTDKKVVKNNSETRILIVEDNAEAIVQVEAVLENQGYKIDAASGGQEALDYIQHTIPDGIILDLMMPDIDGFEVLEKIRSTEKTKNIPVLVLTAKDLSREDLSKLSANNIQQLIHKGDVDIDGLLFKVKLMLGNEPNSSTKNILSGGVKEEGKTGFEENPINNDEKKETENIKGNDRPDKKDLLNVLIVEDNPDNMTTIKAILKGRFNILEAVDGEQGFMIAKSQFPDLILLDISLPRMSGLEMVKLIRGDNSTNKIPVIAVTAHAMQREKEKFIEAGCDGYVPKPIDQEMLLAEIERLVQKIV